MDYFLTSKIVPQNSGIEHAEMLRLKVFARLGRTAAIVTYVYANHAHDFLRMVGLPDDAVINLFDYFADTRDYQPQVPTLATLGLPASATVTATANGWRVTDQGRHIATIQPDQYDNRRWGAVDYVDDAERTWRKAYLDSRGFIGTAISMNGRGRMTRQDFYRPDGRCYLTAWYTQRTRALRRARAYLLRTADGTRRFDSWQSLQAYFYDCLNVGGPHVFISDRAGMTTGAMMAMQTPAIRLEHEHSIHFTDYRDVDSPCDVPRWDDPQFFAALDGIIVPTQRQRADVIRQLHPACPVFAVPVGVSHPQPVVPFTQRTPGQLIAVARPAYQKQLDHMIQAVAQVVTTHPNVKLTIYGVPAGVEGTAELEKLQQLVKSLGLSQVVTFAGYVNDLNAQYDHAQLALLTSRFEGCALALVEAQEHGVPQLAYELNYGTDEVVVPDVTGVLVPQGEIARLASELARLLDHPDQLAAYSQAAYAAATRFSEDAVARRWSTVLREVEA